jgi:RimJ/RimL family protein N-acetyltransferase
MRHNITITGIAYRLRPIEDSDASFVLELRGNKKLNSYLHATPQNIDNQLEWFSDYYKRHGDYYFVIERLSSGKPEGLISIYNIDDALNIGEWGRWILKENSLAAVESAWLIYKCVFEDLGLQQVFCRTVADNKSVVSFHDSCGITQKKLIPNFFEINNIKFNAIEHQVDIMSWVEIKPKLEQLTFLMARRMKT